MKSVITENQYNKLKKSFIVENEKFNKYGLTDEEMGQVEKQAKIEALEYLKELKESKKETEKKIKHQSKTDLSTITDESMRKYITDEIIEPTKRKLVDITDMLKNFDMDKVIGRYRDWHLYSAGGVGYRIRNERYREEALKRKLDKQDIIDLFVTALEGGSNYWYYVSLPKDIKSYGDTTSEAIGEYILEGGQLNFYDIEERRDVIRNYRDGEYTIEGDVIDNKRYNEDIEETLIGYVDLDKVLDAITILKEDYSHVWENILMEQEDANDADIFLQLCVMGDVVFG
jgi:hypothetical protein